LPLAVRRDSGRVGRHTRWDTGYTDAAAVDPPLQVRTIKLHQQYEAPAAVVATVHRLWRPTFDAMATPLSAMCGDYTTRGRRAAIPPNSVVYVNPAYAYAAAAWAWVG